MKKIIKLFTIIFISLLCYNTYAQILSNADAKIIEDMQATIVQMKDKVDNGFDNMILGKEQTKDSIIIEYKAMPLEMLHAQEYLIIKYRDSSSNLYGCTYNNKKSVLLATIAFDNLLKQDKKWRFSERSEEDKNILTNYLIYDDKTIGSFTKAKNGSYLYFYLIQYKDDISHNEKPDPNNNIELYMSDYDRQQDSLDNTIYKTESEKIESIESGFGNLIIKAEDGFIDMIYDESARDSNLIYYKANFQIFMKAQNCQGIKLLPSGGRYFLCSYNKPENIFIAMKAIDRLKGTETVGWNIQQLDMEDTNFVGKKIFLNGKYVAYTTYIKDINQYFIAVKDQVFIENFSTPKKNIAPLNKNVSKKRK